MWYRWQHCHADCSAALPFLNVAGMLLYPASITPSIPIHPLPFSDIQRPHLPTSIQSQPHPIHPPELRFTLPDMSTPTAHACNSPHPFQCPHLGHVICTEHAIHAQTHAYTHSRHFRTLHATLSSNLVQPTLSTNPVRSCLDCILCAGQLLLETIALTLGCLRTTPKTWVQTST